MNIFLGSGNLQHVMLFPKPGPAKLEEVIQGEKGRQRRRSKEVNVSGKAMCLWFGRRNIRKDQKFPRGFDLVAENAFEERGPVQENRLRRCLMIFYTAMCNFTVLYS